VTDFFVDTNVFLRFLTEDIPEQAQAVERLLRRAISGQIGLRTSALVLAEIVWTLESYYRLSRDEVSEKVLAILNTHGLRVESADLIAEAIMLYRGKGIDFVDAFNAVWMREHEIGTAITFDARHFNRVESIQVKTPQEAAPATTQ